MLKLIQREIEEFKQDIRIVDGFSFNQKETIDKIFRYLNSKYAGGEIDRDGDRKHFFNVVRNPCGVETKATDFDTKHIKFLTAAGGDTMKTWFFERDLKFWMKDKNFGRVLNRIFEERPKLGTVVLKTISGVPYFVDLRNFIVEQSADTLDDSNYIIEKHFYTPRQFKIEGKRLGWEKIDEVLKLFRETEEGHVMVYERYGEVPGKDGYRRTLIADVGKDIKNDTTGDTVPHPGVVIKNDIVDKHPYTEFHREKIPGRWLGVGVVETLFEPQVRQNMIANLEAKGDFYASLHVWQTRGEDINANLGRDVVDGQVLTSESSIDPVDMTERNLSYFRMGTDKWLRNRDELVFSYDVIQGERLPAGTPLGSARLAASMASSHFDQLREDLALDVKEYLFKTIIPHAKKELSAKHVLRLVGSDLDKIQEIVASGRARAEMFNFLLRKKKFPVQMQYDAIKLAILTKMKRGQEMVLDVIQGFYDDVKYKIDIIITGEQKDNEAWGQALFAGLQAMQQMQDLLTNPAKKKFFSKWLESYGIPPEDFIEEGGMNTSEQLTQIGSPKGMGGGISAPVTQQAMGQREL